MGRSPNIRIGAAISLRLKASLVVGKKYSGLVALEVSKMVWLKTWLLPKKVSDRLWHLSTSEARGNVDGKIAE